MAIGSQQKLQRERGISVGRESREGDEGLVLFSRIRQNQLVTSSDESKHNVPTTPERIGVRSTTLGRSRINDLLSSDVGKHDYDWLLTPPGTPLFSPSEASDHLPSRVAPRSNSDVRSVSNAKVSRFSAPQPESVKSVRPARSSSTTRSSMSTSFSSSSNFSNRTSVLNTSTASVTSRPSTPGNRSTTVSTVRMTSVPPSRTISSRSSTPTRTRPSLSSHVDKSRSLQNSRPATPTARPRTPSNNPNPSSNALLARSNSRPSTPTRHTTIKGSNPNTIRSTSTSRASVTNSRGTGPASRPSSPAPRARAPVQPLALPDFPLDVPPNLRTKLPERALSASRQRPGLALTVLANPNSETTVPVSVNGRRSSSPAITRGRLQENSSNTRFNNIRHDVKPAERKKPVASEATIRRSIKPASPADGTGFGRTISKKSIDMALKHMDIRQSMGSIRGASFLPPSICTTAKKGRPGRFSDPAVGKVASYTDDSGVSDVTSENDSCSGTTPGGCNGSDITSRYVFLKASQESIMARLTDLDVHSRYDAIMMKEDSKNMSWLHSIEDNPDPGPMFDNHFGPLPEPFGLS